MGLGCRDFCLRLCPSSVKNLPRLDEQTQSSGRLPAAGAAECPSLMRSLSCLAKQSGRRWWSPQPGSPPVSLNAGVSGEKEAGSGVREIPGLLRQSQAQSAALHISSCMQLTGEGEEECVLPLLAAAPASPATKDLLLHLQHPLPSSPPLPPRKERKRKKKETERPGI